MGSTNAADGDVEVAQALFLSKRELASRCMCVVSCVVFGRINDPLIPDTIFW